VAKFTCWALIGIILRSLTTGLSMSDDGEHFDHRWGGSLVVPGGRTPMPGSVHVWSRPR
jgi:hypothetical protein